MTYVRAKENDSFEYTFRKFKKFCEKSALLSDLREKEHYQRPGAKLKKKREAMVKRIKKQARMNSRMNSRKSSY